MNLQQIRYFDAVVKYKTVTQASAHLCISQSSLSRSILRMEQELGHELFYRSGSSIYLTSYGKYFQKKAAEILRLSALSDPINMVFPEIKTIGIVVSYTDPQIIDAITEFLEENPGISVRISHMQSSEIPDHLDQVDLVIANRYLNIKGIDQRNWFFLECAKTEYMAVIPRDSELASKEIVTLRDLHKYPGVYSYSGDNLFLDKNPDDPNTEAILVNRVLLKCRILSLGIYVGIIPSYFRQTFKDEEKVVFRPVTLPACDLPQSFGRFLYFPVEANELVLRLIAKIRSHLTGISQHGGEA